MEHKEKLEYIKQLNKTLDCLLNETEFDNQSYQIIKTKLVEIISLIKIPQEYVIDSTMKPDSHWFISNNMFKA